MIVVRVGTKLDKQPQTLEEAALLGWTPAEFAELSAPAEKP